MADVLKKERAVGDKNINGDDTRLGRRGLLHRLPLTCSGGAGWPTSAVTRPRRVAVWCQYSRLRFDLNVSFDGDDAALAAQAIDPVRQLGTVIDDDVALRPYADTLVDGMALPPGFQLITRSAFVDTDHVLELLRILAEVGVSERPPFIAVRSLGGAVSRVAADATAYAHRQAELLVITTIAGPVPVVEAAR